jgi:hypothetical protein
VRFIEPARYMRWSLPSLRGFMDKRPDLRVTLQGLVNRVVKDLSQSVAARMRCLTGYVAK